MNGASLIHEEEDDIENYNITEDESENYEYLDEEEDEEDIFDRKAYGLHQQLPIKRGVPDYSTGPPQTAEEYLRRVRHEASQLPDIVVSSIDASTFDDERTNYVPTTAGLQNCPTLNEQWLQAFLTDFAQLRVSIQSAEVAALDANEHPSRDDINEWRTYCFGSGAQTDSNADDSGHIPMLEVLRSLNQLSVNRLLKWHITWQCEAPALQGRSVQWIYALASVLEKPLAMGTAAALRDLLRYCAKHQPTTADDAGRQGLLVAIAGAYFRQDERLALLPAVQNCLAER